MLLSIKKASAWRMITNDHLHHYLLLKTFIFIGPLGLTLSPICDTLSDIHGNLQNFISNFFPLWFYWSINSVLTLCACKYFASIATWSQEYVVMDEMLLTHKHRTRTERVILKPKTQLPIASPSRILRAAKRMLRVTLVTEEALSFY